MLQYLLLLSSFIAVNRLTLAFLSLHSSLHLFIFFFHLNLSHPLYQPAVSQHCYYSLLTVTSYCPASTIHRGFHCATEERPRFMLPLNDITIIPVTPPRYFIGVQTLIFTSYLLRNGWTNIFMYTLQKHNSSTTDDRMPMDENSCVMLCVDDDSVCC